MHSLSTLISPCIDHMGRFGWLQRPNLSNKWKTDLWQSKFFIVGLNMSMDIIFIDLFLFTFVELNIFPGHILNMEALIWKLTNFVQSDSEMRRTPQNSMQAKSHFNEHSFHIWYNSKCCKAIIRILQLTFQQHRYQWHASFSNQVPTYAQLLSTFVQQRTSCWHYGHHSDAVDGMKI